MSTVTDEDRYAFDLNGYIVLPGVLSGDQLCVLNELIDANDVASRCAAAGRPNFSGFFKWDPLFRDLLDHPAVLPYLTEWVDTCLRFDHAYGLYNVAGSAGLELHGGATPFYGVSYYHVADRRIQTALTVVSWALSDVPEGAGGFVCIPGSHKSAFPRPVSLGLEDNPYLRHVPMKAGDVLIFTETLTHGTAPWTAAEPRRALLYKYSPGHMAWGVYRMNDEFKEAFTPAQRRLLEPPYAYDGQNRRRVET